MIKKILTLSGLVLFIAACNMNSPEMIEQQIQKKMDQVNEINDQIAILEQQLQADSTDEVTYRVPVSTKLIKPEPFNHYIEITGKLEAEEDAFISPEMNGQIETIHVKEGQWVNKGHLLISLNTSLIESSIQEVETGLELANKLYDKQKELWGQNIGSELEYLEAKNGKEQAEARLATLNAQLDMARIRAPFNGVVETIMRKEGELAVPGVQLLQLINLDKLKLYGNISERYLTSVKAGDEVIVSFPDLNDLTLNTPIFRVGNTIDNASRTFRIELKLKNKKGVMKPNMYSIIKINDFSSSSAYVVPSFVIKQDIKGNYLYIADKNELKADKKYVTTGLSYGDQTMIQAGIEEGDEVVIKGFAQVSHGVDIDLR